jgi:hypothetical protein
MIEERVLAEYDRVREGQGQGVAEGRTSAPRPLREEAPLPAPDLRGQTLEEVEELHLRDSFWTVT